MLWCHVALGAHLRRGRYLEGAVQGVRDAHVDYFDLLLIASEHDIPRLQVLMNYLLFMQVIDPTDQLAANPLNYFYCQFLVFLDEASEVAAVAVFDDNMRLVLLFVRVVFAHEVFVFYNILMIELCTYFEFLKFLLYILLCHLRIRECVGDLVDEFLARKALDTHLVSMALIS